MRTFAPEPDSPRPITRSLLIAALLVLPPSAASLAQTSESNSADHAGIGRDITVAEGETAGDIACAFCSVRIHGDVRGDVAVLFGSVRVDAERNISGDVALLAATSALATTLKSPVTLPSPPETSTNPPVLSSVAARPSSPAACGCWCPLRRCSYSLASSGSSSIWSAATATASRSTPAAAASEHLPEITLASNRGRERKEGAASRAAPSLSGSGFGSQQLTLRMGSASRDPSSSSSVLQDSSFLSMPAWHSSCHWRTAAAREVPLPA